MKNFFIKSTIFVVHNFFWCCSASAEQTASSDGFSKHPKALAFIESMVKEHGFKAQELRTWIDVAERKQAIIDAISRPAEKTKPWHEYRNIFLKPERVELGAQFWHENQEQLQSVYEAYGVSPEIIVAIIGVETYYGRYMGNYRVIDALTTLSFEYPPRGKFFTRELSAFFLLAREQKQDPLALMGSYAGAMGYGQFIPSSYRAYARDGDGDGTIDIWANKKDAITSVGHYFKAHGWQRDKPVVVPAKLEAKFDRALLNSRQRPKYTLAQLKNKGFESQKSLEKVIADPNTKAMPLAFKLATDERAYKLGLNNFYVITRYNHSRLYALAVWELSQEIKARYTSDHQTIVHQESAASDEISP